MLVEKNPLTMVKSLMKRRSGLRRELLLCSFFTLVVHNLFYRVYFIGRAIHVRERCIKKKVKKN